MNHLPPHLPPLPDEYLIAIGRVAVSWNYLDFCVNLFMIHLLGVKVEDDRSHIIFTHTSFPQKLDILAALVETVKNSPHYAGFKDYKTRVQPLIETAQRGRNTVIHSQWAMRNGDVMRGSISARRSLKLTYVKSTVDEIETVHNSIVAAHDALVALLPSRPSSNPHIGQ